MSSWRARFGPTLARLRLFLSSYAPAFAIAALRFDGAVLRGLCIATAVVGVADAFFLPRLAARSQTAVWITVDRVENVGAEVSAYFATYLFPLLTAPKPSVRDLIAYGIFLALSALIYVQSDLVRVNPTMFALGYRVLRVSLPNGESNYLLCVADVRADMKVPTARLAGVLVAKGEAIDADSN